MSSLPRLKPLKLDQRPARVVLLILLLLLLLVGSLSPGSKPSLLIGMPTRPRLVISQAPPALSTAGRITGALRRMMNLKNHLLSQRRFVHLEP